MATDRFESDDRGKETGDTFWELVAGLDRAGELPIKIVNIYNDTKLELVNQIIYAKIYHYVPKRFGEFICIFKDRDVTMVRSPWAFRGRLMNDLSGVQTPESGEGVNDPASESRRPRLG